MPRASLLLENWADFERDSKSMRVCCPEIQPTDQQEEEEVKRVGHSTFLRRAQLAPACSHANARRRRSIYHGDGDGGARPTRIAVFAIACLRACLRHDDDCRRERARGPRQLFQVAESRLARCTDPAPAVVVVVVVVMIVLVGARNSACEPTADRFERRRRESRRRFRRARRRREFKSLPGCWSAL